MTYSQRKNKNKHKRHDYTITDGYSLVNELDLIGFAVCIASLTTVISWWTLATYNLVGQNHGNLVYE